jgi:hypothetical protein
MIDTSDWVYVFKTLPDGSQRPTNMVYTPMTNRSNDILCMNWNIDRNYQTNTAVTSDLIDFLFQREIKYFSVFQGHDWCPKIIDIDIPARKIFLEWNPNTCNKIIFADGKNLSHVCPDWKQQMFGIIQDIRDRGYYKMALYPHCFFIDQDLTLKTIDFYGCVESSHPFVERKSIEDMIGPDSGGRFDLATQGDLINFEILFKHTMLTHLSTVWPDNPFPEYFGSLYGS